MNHLGGLSEWFVLSGYSGAHNPGFSAVMWTPERVLVVCHPGTKRLICLPCLDSFECSLMVLWALPGLSCVSPACCKTVGGSRIARLGTSLASMAVLIF